MAKMRVVSDTGLVRLQKYDVYLHNVDDGTYLATPALTVDGVQYSNEKITTTANVNIPVFSATINVHSTGIAGILRGLFLNLEAQFKGVSATADLIWKWQARNSGGTWVDLHPAVTDTDINTTYLTRIRKGFFRPILNLTTAPIDIQLLLQANELNGGYGKVSNNSFVTVAVMA